MTATSITQDPTVQANAREIADAFNAKAAEMAQASGKDLDHCKAVMLAYLKDTAPDEARTILVSLLLADRDGLGQ